MSAQSPGQQQQQQQQSAFKAFVASALRPKKSRNKLRKKTSTTSLVGFASRDDNPPPLPPLAPLQAHRAKYRDAAARMDTQLGENKDYTAMIHALGLAEPFDDTDDSPHTEQTDRPPGEPAVASLSEKLWAKVAEHLSPRDAASLALASKTLYRRLGGRRPFEALNEPANRQHKIDFLVSALDRHLPHHLLCIPCAKFHLRTQEGHEKLQPARVLNPLFDCPNARNVLLPPPRHRITHTYTLPFTFVQLAVRAHRFADLRYGIPVESLARRWTETGNSSRWTHHTRFLIHDGRLLMRVVSSCFADPGLPPSAVRLLLYNRDDDYRPYFSVCAHWRDGELMDVCKCALSHIPQTTGGGGYQALEHRLRDALRGAKPSNPNNSAVVSLCAKCRPKRRCPDCPTEYLVEIKLAEDRGSSSSGPRNNVVRLRHAIVVTRWSDLGDGTSPGSSPEWAACNGDIDDGGYDSFQKLGRRALSGIFEAALTADTVPGQRIVSLNPERRRRGEEGDGWY